MSEDYPWQKPYHDAVLETDNEKLRQLIAKAEQAIDSRLHNTEKLPSDEYDTIAQTLTALSILKTERITRESSDGGKMRAS